MNKKLAILSLLFFVSLSIAAKLQRTQLFPSTAGLEPSDEIEDQHTKEQFAQMKEWADNLQTMLDETFRKTSLNLTSARFVDRDPATADWSETGSKAVLDTDGTWNDLDCSSIVPVDAVVILFRVYVKDDAADSLFRMRKNGNTSAHAVGECRTQVANIANHTMMTIPCDKDRKVEYWGKDVAFISISVSVVGWWL